ncbi:MAG: cation:proton antiporter [Candidatus Woesearchaeota archaeon]
MEAITYLTKIVFMFLVGILATMLSNRFRIPNIMLLVLAGIISRLIIMRFGILEIPKIFILITSIVALALITFDGASRFKFKEFDTFSMLGLKVFLIFLVLCLSVITPILIILLKFQLMFALIFSSMITATAFEVLSIFIRKDHLRVSELLKTESILNTPFTVIMPFMFYDFFKNLSSREADIFNILEYSVPFVQQLIIGIGSGIFVGIIIFKFMRKYYSENISPIALVVGVLTTYVLAEQLKGSGVLAVVVLGIFFGNIHVKKKPVLQEFSSLISGSIEIIVFLLFGYLATFPNKTNLIITSLLIYVVSIILRFMSVTISLSHYPLRDRIFASLATPKGISFVAVTITFSAYNILPEEFFGFLFLFFVYSIIISTFMIKTFPMHQNDERFRK